MDQEEQAKQLASNGSGCSVKSIFKCFLFYFTALLILGLIFTGANNEPKDVVQTRWWWAFTASLLATASMSATALAILIYTDYYKSVEQASNEMQQQQQQQQQQNNDDLPTSIRLRPNRKTPGYDLPDSLKTVSVSWSRNANIPLVTMRQGDQQLQEPPPTMDTNRPPPQPLSIPVPIPQPIGQQQPQAQENSQDFQAPESPAGFVNFTPDSAKSPVTVVDMTLNKRKNLLEQSQRVQSVVKPATPTRRLEEPSNLASVTSQSPSNIQDSKKPRRKARKPSMKKRPNTNE